MSSSEDMFLDESSSPRMIEPSPMESSPSSPLKLNSDPTPGSPSPTPPKPPEATPTPPSPSPCSLQESEVITGRTDSPDGFDVGLALAEEPGEEATVKQIKVEFYDSKGVKVRQSRYVSDSGVIDIVSNLVRVNDTNNKNATVSKLCESAQFKQLIQKSVLKNCSQTFSHYISLEICPLKNKV